MEQNLINSEQIKYVISYNINIIDESLFFHLESSVDFSKVLTEKELEFFILDNISKYTKEAIPRCEIFDTVFANNICFFKEGDEYPFYSIMNKSVQIYPLVK